MSGKGILGVGEMPGVREEGGTSLRSARISLVPTNVCYAGYRPLAVLDPALYRVFLSFRCIFDPGPKN